MSRESGSSSGRTYSKCNCKVPLALRKSWTSENPGRRFFTCKFYNPGTNFRGCEFFKWYDQNQCGWQRDVINELVLEKKLLSKELEIVKVENSHLEEQNNRLKEEIELLRMRTTFDDNESDERVTDSYPKKALSTALYVVVVVLCIMALVKVLI
ncbi:hypothetical protein RND81_07G064200 [Saponaria officinalis]|uniref:GRF-type domain-containing protein n=1 Tax=Saponaria officinalis TaxID=3572 RepID=A0AAW1JN21_SAPOF